MNPAIDRIIGERLEKDPNPTGLLKQIKDRLMRQAEEEAKANVMAESLAEGRAESSRKTARKMLAAGTFTTEQISEFSGLALEEVRELKKEIE